MRGLGLFVVEVLDSSWRCWTPAAGVRSVRWTCLSSWPQRFPPMEHCWRKIDRDSSCAVAIQHRALTRSVSMRSQLASDLLGVRGGGGRCSSDAQVLVAVAPRGLWLLVVRHVAPV